MSSRYSNAEIRGPIKDNASWHNEFSNSPFIYVGGLPYDVDESDIATVFSQFGEVMKVNLAKELGTGKSKGYAFLAYENPKSAILAVDNFDGIEVKLACMSSFNKFSC